MKLKLYAVHDKLIGYKVPFTEVNDAVAKRGFCQAIISEFVNTSLNGDIDHYCYDLSLFCVGEFDSKTGQITPCIAPEFICSGVDAINLDKAGDVNENE